MLIKYCKVCVLPSTKPDLGFDQNNICDACNNYQNRKSIDWKKRYEDLLILVKKYKNIDFSNWDCVVPVSGGKDSTYQVLQVIKLGLNPLCVTSTTCDLSDLGKKNIQNIKNLGVDLIEVSPDPKIRARLNAIGLKRVGDISWPEHVGIFTIPVQIALKFNIKLIVWGENSQNEYGGPSEASNSNILNRRWLEEFGGLLGMRTSDIIKLDNIHKKKLIHYEYPSEELLKNAQIEGVFLGHYIPWDGLNNSLIAQMNGFSTYEKLVEGSIVNYENLDNHQTGIHDYFKFLKFGFGRASDIASLLIRRGKLDRSDAIKLVKKLDGKFPWYYLGKKLEDILKPLNISIDEFVNICDEFTNKKIFKKDNDGKLFKDNMGNLEKNNYDN